MVADYFVMGAWGMPQAGITCMALGYAHATKITVGLLYASSSEWLPGCGSGCAWDMVTAVMQDLLLGYWVHRR